MPVVASNEFRDINPAARAVIEMAELPIDDASAQNNRMRAQADSLDDIARHVEAWTDAGQDALTSRAEAGQSARLQQRLET